MPELPEVQTTVNGLQKRVVGLSIRDIWTDYRSPFHANKDNIKDPRYFARFRRAVIGARIEGASRRGKNVLIHLSNGQTILVHMKMTGHLLYGRYERSVEGTGASRRERWLAVDPGPLRDDPFNRYIRLAISLSDGKVLALSDLRKFAKVTLIETARIGESLHLSSHGPEPLEAEFDARALREALSRRPNMPIKQALMNPELVSGIGNIYSDEILWRAGIHPLTRVRSVPSRLWVAVWKAMRETLKKGIDLGGDSMSDYRDIAGESGRFQAEHQAYRRTGDPCRKRGCSGTIRRIKVGGRSAHFCDRHQKLW